MKKIFSSKGLHISSPLKTCCLALLFGCSVSLPLRADDVKCLHLDLMDGSSHQITLKGDITMTPIDDDILDILSDDGNHQMPIKHIVKFHVNNNLAVDGVISDSSENWSIVSLDGVLIKSGVGIPDFSSLDSGEIYIVRQGTLTYKFIAR